LKLFLNCFFTNAFFLFCDIQGAHHSDLSHVGPTPKDTPDVKEAFARITTIIGRWLEEVEAEGEEE
jgi:hypothetical protein